jgi:hypothetical protein
MKSLAAAALAFVAACGGSDIPSAASGSVAGTYTLRTVNGTSLPFVLSQTGPSKTEVVDDAFTLVDNGTWTQSGHKRNTVNGQVITTGTSDAGTFTQSGTAITLSSATTGALVGTIANGTLSLTEEGVAFVYIK